MLVFGKYETTRELYRSGLASSWAAKKVDAEGGENFVVKSFMAFAVDADEDQVAQERETFLDGARAQQKAAAEGAKHWAPVRDVDSFEGGAYYVTDYHPRSVQHLIRGRVNFDGGGLYRLIREVIEGLIEFKRICKRPHGDLKPSNILLTGKGDVSRSTVLLTDPVGAGRLDSQQGDVPDLHVVGELIYQLVLHRAGRAMKGWPAPPSKEWDRLGKNGDAWSQLCNRLLNPNLAPGLMTFEDIAEDLDKLRERVLPLAPIAIGVGVVGAAIAAAVFLLPTLWPGGGNGGDAADFDAKAWQRLCGEFSGWVEPLLGQAQSGRLEAWGEDEHLKTNVLGRVRTIIDRIQEFNPAAMASYYAGNLAFLGENPTEEAKAPKAVEQTRKALAAIDELRKAFLAEKWPACDLVRQGAEGFRQRNWEAPAAYLDGLLPFSEQTVISRVEAILAVQEMLKAVDERWVAVVALQKKIEVWGPADTKPLRRLGEFIEAEAQAASGQAGAESLKGLSERLDDLLAEGGLLRRLEAFIARPQPPAKPLDWPLVAKEPPFGAGPDGKVTDMVLRGGLARLASGHYDVRPDPRTAEWKGRIDDLLVNRRADLRNLQQRIAKVRETVGKGDLSADAGRRIAAELDAIEGAGKEYPKSLQEAEKAYAGVTGLAAYNSETRRQIDGDMTRVESALKDLARRIGGGVRGIGKLEDDIDTEIQGTWDEVVSRLKARTKVSTSGLAEIDRVWVAQRDALLKTEKVAKDLSQKAKRVETFLADLEAAFSDEPLLAQAELRSWNRLLATAEVASRRAHAVASCLSYADWPKVAAGQADSNFIEMRDHQVAAYNALRTGLASLLPALNRIEDALASGYQLTESPPKLSATLREFYLRQQKTPVFSDPALKRAAQPIFDRLAELQGLAAQSDPAGLLAMANRGRQDHFESARGAWLRLGQLDRAWLARPSDPKREVLKQELEIHKSLRAVYELLPDAGRKAELQKELSGEGPRRWQVYFLARSDPAVIADTAARRSQFGVTDGAGLSAFARFRLAVHDFRRDVAARPDSLEDEAVKAAIARFQQHVKPLATVTAKSDVAAMLAELEKARTAEGGSVDLSKAGPALQGWTKTNQTAETVSYAWPEKKYELTFRRVTPAGGKPCFLSTTEVSVGLFVDRVASDRKWADVSKLVVSDDDMYGPRVWTAREGRMAVGSEWLAELPPPLEGKMYSPETQPGPVTADHPVQQVSLAAAVYFARLLNCRLPTSGEWLAAYEADPPAAGAANLRDKTWGQQKAHAMKLEDDGDLMDREQYYPDAGIFWPKSIASSDRKVSRDAVVPGDAGTDKRLWPAKTSADEGRKFAHLVGNVAEYVFDSPEAVANLKALTPDGLQSLLASAAGGAGGKVIGGSAMSAPQVPFGKPQPLASPGGRDGYSDVGFRLAFFAGRERLQSRVLRLLKAAANEGYFPAVTP